jgi:FKBP-type peptidyl-prolyl cis-trans isomerase
MFDDSHLRGEGGMPYTFTVGKGDAIIGVEEGMIGMKVGGKRRIKLPPKLVFGSTGYSTIMGNQVVFIDVELLSIG